MVAKKAPLLMPALRGRMGDWVYYVCLLSPAELGARVSYANEIHDSPALSQMIQRQLEGPRSKKIASYLKNTPQRFFNSLVLATYGGKPEWLEIGNFKARSARAIRLISEIDDLESIGVLSLTGKERIFAIDGQHRLAGIKNAVETGASFGSERLPVIFLSHEESSRERTRRLFTTLNKTAKPVAKADIIALDEDDAMAIIVRRLVEGHEWFQSPKIAVTSSPGLPPTNKESITTIVNLYDITKHILKFNDVGFHSDQRRFYRPDDDRLERLQAGVVEYFTALARAFPPVGRLFAAQKSRLIVSRFRSSSGGHLLFRPVGMEILVRLATKYATAKKCTLARAISQLAVIPVEISGAPYRNVIWDATSGKMTITGRTLAIDVLSYMVGLEVATSQLEERYAKAVGDADGLPDRLITAKLTRARSRRCAD